MNVEESVGEILRRHRAARAPCCRSSTTSRQRFGFVPDAAVPIVAEALNLSRAEVHGVVTFYHDSSARRRRGR